MSTWPRWAFILFIVGVGLAGLLLVILAAMLCARHRRRAGLTTVSSSSSMQREHQQQQPPLADYKLAADGSFVALPQVVVVPPRRLMGALPVLPVGADGLDGMVDVPLASGRGRGPVDPFGGYGPGAPRMAGLGVDPVKSSAFSEWGSPKEKGKRNFARKFRS